MLKSRTLLRLYLSVDNSNRNILDHFPSVAWRRIYVYSYSYQQKYQKNYRMIGLVIVTHSRLSEEMLNVVQHVLGPVDNQTATVSIGPNLAFDDGVESICQAIKTCNESHGVIVITDLYGSTPYNMAHKACSEMGASLVSGANIPLLIKLFSLREEGDMESVLHQAVAAGGQYIRIS